MSNYCNGKSIILIIGTLGGGGSERIMAQIANFFARIGIKTTLVTFQDPTLIDCYFVDPSVKRINFSTQKNNYKIFPGYNFLMMVTKVRKLIKKKNPTVVLSFLTITNVVSILATRGLRVRCIISERTNLRMHKVSSGIGIARKVFYRFANRIVVQTKMQQTACHEMFGLNSVVIPNFIRKLPHLERKPENFVMGIGRLAVEKNFSTLIDAFSKIHKTYPIFKLVLIGEGPEEEKLKELVRQLKIEGHVIFLGYIKNVEEWISRANVVVQPSSYEGFPNAVLESMALGVPVIASEEAGKAIIDNGKDGLLLKDNKVEELIFALRTLIDSPNQQASISKSAVNVRYRYSEEAIMPFWEDVLYGKNSCVE